MADLLQTFETELRKSTEQIQACLLSVENAKAADAAKALHEAYRLTHSVKGASRVVGLSSIEEMAHALEETLGGLVRGASRPDAKQTTAFLKVVDGFSAGLEAFREGMDFDPEPYMREFRNLAGAGLERQVPAGTGLLQEAPEAEATPAGGGGGAAEAEASSGGLLPAARDEFLRVPTQSADELFRRVEEAFLIEARLTALVQRLEESGGRTERHVTPELQRETSRLHQVLVQFHELVRSFRMEPFERLRMPLQRAVRDLAETLNRSVAFRFTGRHELVDAATLDALHEPLLHAVRNAVDHGVETPAERRAAGKPEEAVVEVIGLMRGGTLEIRVGDDGRGISVEKVREKALSGGFVKPDEAAGWTDAQWIDLVFHAGFSTRSEVSNVSGRGLGMEIVRDRIQGLGGSVRITSQPGQGTTIEMRVPVRLLTARTLLVRCGGHTAGIPVADVDRVIAFQAKDTEVSGGRTLLRYQGTPVLVEPLATHLGWEAATGTHVVLVGRDGAQRGFMVDEIVGEIEQPAMPAPWNLRGLSHLGGVVVLGDGSVVPLIEVRELTRGEEAPRPEPAPTPRPASAAPERRRILVVDDSPTIRALHRSVLEGANYDVVEAEDGSEGLEALRRESADLVVTDIQMPKMDGLTLIRRLRETAAWRRLPVIVVSQYGRKEDLQKAAALGADRYIVKSNFEPQRLIEMIRELVD